MSIIIKNEFSGSVRTPDAGKINIFYDETTRNLYGKTANGSFIPFASFGRAQYVEALNGINATTSSVNVGSLFLNSGTLSTSSSVYVGTVTGSDVVTVNLYRERDAFITATWVMSGQLTNTYLSAAASIPSDEWYSIRFRLSSGIDTGLLRGIKIVLD